MMQVERKLQHGERSAKAFLAQLSDFLSCGVESADISLLEVISEF
jgi:hypothetical protein